jgi:outer membrane protein assembly factor BamE (lipoprotein component of BamABCDE complex)
MLNDLTNYLWRRSLQTIAVALLSALAGCAALLPEAKKLEVQQGKVLERDAIDALAEGQSRQHVRDLLGDPVLASSFHGDRWDYVYYRTRFGEQISPHR